MRHDPHRRGCKRRPRSILSVAAFDHRNLFVADASTLVTSAAVNPSLTVAALALRTADHIERTELGL